MAIQHSNWRAVRERAPAIFTVDGVVSSPDASGPGGYSATTGARLIKLYSPDPAIRRLELVLDLEHRAPPASHQAQLERAASYQENPAGEASKAYTHVHVRYLGNTLAEIPVRDVE